jgi:hypothetical protein
MTAEVRSGDTAWFRQKRKVRFLLLVMILCVLAIGYVFNNIIDISQIKEGVPRKEVLEYESRVLPNEEAVLSYLDGKDVVPTDTKGISASGSAPITLKKESIEGLTIKHEDHFFTLATFTLKSDRGPYAIEILINHNPSDGTYVFDWFRVQKASKQ